MKRYFILFLSVIFLFLVSCATKKIDVPADKVAPIAPVENSVQSEGIDKKNREILNQAENQENLQQKEETRDSEHSSFENPSPIDEPEITTTALPENQYENKFEESVESEIVADEEPPQLKQENKAVGNDDADDDADADDDDKNGIYANENSFVDGKNGMAEKTDSSVDKKNSTFDDEQKSDDEVIDVDSDKTVVVGDEDENVDNEQKNQADSGKNQNIVPSRKITVKKMEYVDVSYPGTGWIYMGLTDGSKALSYFGRKLGTKNTDFTLQAREAGNYIIHFYRNDALTKTYLDDYVQVEIMNEKGDSKIHKKVPEYKQPVPNVVIEKKTSVASTAKENTEMQNKNTSAQQKTESEKNETKLDKSQNQTLRTVQKSGQNAQTVAEAAGTKNIDETAVTANVETTETKDNVTALSNETAAKNNEDSDSENSDILLKTAETQYNEKQYIQANETLKKFFEFATEDRDKGLYLQGQILEAKSAIQNIKAAIQAYTTLTKNYQSSKYWNDANKRIIYLKRFYLEVR